LTAAAADPTLEDAARAAALDEEARALAEEHRNVVRAERGPTGLFEGSPFVRALVSARKHLAATPVKSAAHGKAGEWFLDNYYFIRRVARQVTEELPRGFLRHLPRLASERGGGLPRIDALARALVAKGVEFDLGVLKSFIDAYQETSVLTIAELWALPTMLRGAVLRAMLEFLGELDVPIHRARWRDRVSVVTPSAAAKASSKTGPKLLPAAGVERSVRALRILSEVDWKTFFEKTNRVEAVLRKDPTLVYSRMDFETCDSYRKAVERVAWATGTPEERVAELAVSLAADDLREGRERDVGYYLVGDGQRILEDRVGYRPRGIEWVRRTLRSRPTLYYLSSLAVLTLAPLLVEGWYLADKGVSWPALLVTAIVTAGPVSVAAMTLVQWTLAHVLPPRTLPKLNFSKGLPSDFRTLVVMPTLLGRSEDVDEMIRQIELHYLSNPDPGIQFALLTDDVDTKSKSENTELLELAAAGVLSLNSKYGTNGVGPFHLLHRALVWNESEGRFMGWERKRGKLFELNRLLRGDKLTTYTHQVGNPKQLEKIRYVITLDSDTQLPIGSAQRLVGLFAHPLNRAVFDDRTGRVVSGYTIVQPRIETSPSGARETRFSKIFSGDVGYDIYTHASSDLYQDLFGTAIYVGKGIYDVDAFMRSVDGRVPENTIASHDLFEGVHGRTALATDIVLFEGYPFHYAAYARRMHRWVRGDWQLVPWLFPKVPAADGKRIGNPLQWIDRWKIIDNLRRSLTAPLFVLLLVFGWTWLPGKPILWTLGAIGLLFSPMLPSIANRRQRVENLERCALAIAFLAHESAVVVDAVVRVAVRTLITKKHLLEWTSASQTASGLRSRSPRALLWVEMFLSPALSLAVAALVAWVHPSALVVAAPFLALWLIAPEIARWVSLPLPTGDLSLSTEDRRKLRYLARRTWLFFETFVGPNDQWLPIDNYQEEPEEQTAHRTSPTNIGMLLLSTLSAYDLGYLGPSELSLRVRRSFESISRLSHYQGHLLNWYDTRSLEPLLPRYVSTVDSGNFAGCLLALKEGCTAVARARVLRPAEWDGVADSLDLLEEAIAPLARTKASALVRLIVRMRAAVAYGKSHPDAAYETLRDLVEEVHAELDRELFALVETGAYRNETKMLESLRQSVSNLRHQLQQMLRELDTLLPWLALKNEPAACAIPLPADLRLDEISGASASLSDRLTVWEREQRNGGELSSELVGSIARVRQALLSAGEHSRALCHELLDLAALADREVSGMDFRLLFDAERKLFHIGYNVTVDRLDSNYYDLLASEARLASYLAIVKHQVPESHWYTLGRPMTSAAGPPALLSWGGTMFEYLMPSLLMRSREGTLLHQTSEHVVTSQIRYGEERKAPWGISESAYARLDAQQTYQYRSFGVPGLGFKRGLEEDLVVAPYASLLALSIRPRAVIENLARLEAMGMSGAYGMFEAVDLERDRAEEGQTYDVVRSYMAHHQGMLLIAINNYLNEEIMVTRFHSDLMVETGEMLLNERAPATAPKEWPKAEGAELGAAAGPTTPASAPEPWLARTPEQPQAFVVSNGRLTSLLTGAGGGGLFWQGLALTRYEPDPTRPGDGMWIYVRDEETGHVWMATSERGRTTYALHKVEFHRREEGISIHVDVAVAPADDVEVRQITLRNETDQYRRLTVTSAGEPALVPARDASAHPAFNRMFIESEWERDLDALVFARRARSEEEPSVVMVHRLVREGPRVRFGGYETDRAIFFGRGGSVDAPKALSRRGPLSGHTGATLDPVISLMATVELRPKETATLAFVTAVDRSRGAALDLAKRYGSTHAVRWAFRDADHESRRRLQRTQLDPDLLPAVQRLFSALHFADRSLGPSPDVVANGEPCKGRLWGRGVSGDDPILLVRVHDADGPLVREVIAAQRYLRSCNVRLDLVFVDEKATGYASDAPGTLRAVLAQCGVEEWLNRHGGIVVLPADQLSSQDRLLFEASARAVLDTRDGSLDSRTARHPVGQPRLPRLEATLVENAAARVPALPKLLFDNGTGGFTEDGREYVVAVRPGKPSPAPWCNVLANEEFGCLVSEGALGCTWSGNSGENRLTPWRNDAVLDTPSEVLYLRDEETAAVWSSTPLPSGDGETHVHHGAGYTRYVRESHGLLQELTIFVPHDAPLKVAQLRLTNTRPRHRRLTATYYAEWVLGRQREEQRAYVTSELDRPNACVLARCPWNAEFAGRVAFLASERAIHGFTADRTEFLGRGGDYSRPDALERWGLSGRVDAGADPCAALQIHLELAPGERIETHFILGQGKDRGDALELVQRFRDPLAVGAAWSALGAFWDGILGDVTVKTPEPAMDLMLNRWLLYQTISARIFGRTGFYQSSGAFGFRDQLQDVLALLHASPDRTRAHILEAAAHQFEEGDVLHWWHPPEGRGVRTRCSDDMAWLPYVTADYVFATGDKTILSESVPFLTGKPLESSEHDRYAKFDAAPHPASLFEHCKRALERAITEGRHGLPRMGDGDWNDGMNRVGSKGIGESVWLGWFLVATMTRFAALCECVDDGAQATRWRARANSLSQTLGRTAWDGAWYIRAFHDDGSLLGSAKERECQIDSIAQSWAVLSGGADEARARVALASADQRLVREADRLVLLLAPPFDLTPHDPGYIRAYPPGVRENGGQYTHGATWLGWAYATLGEGGHAERIFRLLNPVLRTKTPQEANRYRVEPYVVAGDIYSTAPHIGRGGWSWYTGAAAWLWRLGVEAILGLYKEDGHLRVDPCIPPSWREFEAWVHVDGIKLHITVENPNGVTKGVATITVDGVSLPSNRIGPAEIAREGAHEVRVRLGSPRISARGALPNAGQAEIGQSRAV
jgi:cyclic beta-1,2-glucan synthetase